MVGELVKTIYKYENVELASGAKVNAQEVTTQEGKVTNIPNGNITVKVGEVDRSFNFSIYDYWPNGSKTYNLSNVPEGVDGQAIVKEFVDFVEADIV